MSAIVSTDQALQVRGNGPAARIAGAIAKLVKTRCAWSQMLKAFNEPANLVIGMHIANIDPHEAAPLLTETMTDNRVN